MINKYSQYKIVWFKEKLESFFNKKIEAPIYVRIKPTNRCVHKCYFCIYQPEFSGMHGTFKRDDQLPKEKLIEVVNDLKQIGVKAVTFSGGGEPLFHPDIVEILNEVNRLGLDNSIITNGQLLSGDKAAALKDAKWVRISMDYYDAPSFEKTRRIPGESVFEIYKNIKNFAKIKNKNCDLSVNFIVTDDNYAHLFEVAKNLKELGIENVRFAPIWVSNFKSYHEPLKDEVLSQLKQAREKLNDGNFTVYDSYNIDFQAQKRTLNRCYMMQILPIIGADGNVYSCHNKAYDKDGLIGSIKDKKFSEMWFSPEAKAVFENLNPTKYCSHHQCAADAKNILINEILQAKDDNFI